MAKKGFIPWNTGTSKTKVTITCECCGKTIDKYLHNRKEIRFCSNRCAHKVMGAWNKGIIGKESHLWKEDKKSKLNNVIRQSQLYVEWRLMIYGRDMFTCQKCKQRGKYLEAHHIISLRKIIKDNKLTYDNFHNCEQLWDLDNGITYCSDCHMEEDKMRKRFKKINDIMGGD
jgi:endogenous inhibitor of DNA gyrase (YacG/DUF329 family)